jgi:hypothetical protein
MKSFAALTLAVVSILVMVSLAQDGVRADTAANSNTGLIERLYVTSSGTINVRLKDRPSDAENCGDSAYYFVGPTEPSKNQLYAALLTAWTNREVVKLRVPDSHVPGTNCPIQYIVIDK